MARIASDTHHTPDSARPTACFTSQVFVQPRTDGASKDSLSITIEQPRVCIPPRQDWPTQADVVASLQVSPPPLASVPVPWADCPTPRAGDVSHWTLGPQAAVTFHQTPSHGILLGAKVPLHSQQVPDGLSKKDHLSAGLHVTNPLTVPVQPPAYIARALTKVRDCFHTHSAEEAVRSIVARRMQLLIRLRQVKDSDQHQRESRAWQLSRPLHCRRVNDSFDGVLFFRCMQLAGLPTANAVPCSIWEFLTRGTDYGGPLTAWGLWPPGTPKSTATKVSGISPQTFRQWNAAHAASIIASASAAPVDQRVLLWNATLEERDVLGIISHFGSRVSLSAWQAEL